MIHCAVKNHLGFITLDRPEKLNALNESMFLVIKEALDRWEKDSAIYGVIIHSAVKRAFSAGGDLKELYHIWQQSTAKEAPTKMDDFFQLEYGLNEKIHGYPKPYIALLNGIGMGGGLGVSLHGKYRIVDETVALAMPECAIGFFPDAVSASFLRECPGFIGSFLAVTGYHMNAADAIYTGLGTHFMSHETMGIFLEALGQAPIDNSFEELLYSLLDYFAGSELPMASNIAHHRDLIDESFSKPSLEEALATFSLGKGPWVRQVLDSLDSLSPLSLKVTYEMMRRSRKGTFKDLREMNHVLARNFLFNREVIEGIRAKMIDKDNYPRWQYGSIEDVPDHVVQAYFEGK